MSKISNLVLFMMLFSFMNFISLTSEAKPGKTQQPKYIFLFIGDGMGQNQSYATNLFLNPTSKGGQTLVYNQFPVQNFMTTYSANDYITCSSASITAISTGHKTNNGRLLKSPNTDSTYFSIAEWAHAEGFNIGIVSSVGINHATPAGFYGHQNSRNMYYEIALELPQSGFEYFGGGGLIDSKGKKGDQADAYAIAQNKGYQWINSIEGFNQLKYGNSNLLVTNPILEAEAEFPWVIDSIAGNLSLAQFTSKGIEILGDGKGFFMMVEGGKIDWACHSNDGASMLYEVIAFNKAVNEAYQFYLQHPDETLIIVTADHETGGLALGIEKNLKPELMQYQNISLQKFQKKVEMWVADSLHPRSFEEVMQSVQFHFGLGNAQKGLALSNEEMALFKAAYRNDFVNHTSRKSDADYLDHEGANGLAQTAVDMLNHKAGFSWASHDHTATPVPLYVIGAGSENFTGKMDNSMYFSKFQNLMKRKK